MRERTAQDEGRLSAYDGDVIPAEGSWKHHTRLGLGSAGVLAITGRECEAESLSREYPPLALVCQAVGALESVGGVRAGIGESGRVRPIPVLGLPRPG